MKISLNWLNRYLPLAGVSTDELKRAITFLGFEVEGVVSTALPPLQNVVVGEIKTRDKKKGGKSYKIDPIYEPQEVEYYDGEEPGTIVINSQDKFLFLVEEGNRARRYGVAIGKEGLGWTGEARVASKVEWPSWTPTDEMIARSPEHYAKYKDGMPGGPTPTSSPKFRPRSPEDAGKMGA